MCNFTIILPVMYFAFSVVQFFAIYAWFHEIHKFDPVVSFIGSIIISPIPLVSQITSTIGAIDVFGWDWPETIILFWGGILFFLVSIFLQSHIFEKISAINLFSVDKPTGQNVASSYSRPQAAPSIRITFLVLFLSGLFAWAGKIIGENIGSAIATVILVLIGVLLGKTLGELIGETINSSSLTRSWKIISMWLACITLFFILVLIVAAIKPDPQLHSSSDLSPTGPSLGSAGLPEGTAVVYDPPLPSTPKAKESDPGIHYKVYDPATVVYDPPTLPKAKGVNSAASTSTDRPSNWPTYLNKYLPTSSTRDKDAELKTQQQHMAQILSQHPDALALIPEVEQWISHQTEQVKNRLNWVLDHGNAKEVINLYDVFKEATGKSADATLAASTPNAHDDLILKPTSEN